MNPRYVNYARAHGMGPDAMLDHDRNQWPGGVMTGFILWNTARLQDFGKINPRAFIGHGLIDHAAYDRWLTDWVDLQSAEGE